MVNKILGISLHLKIYLLPGYTILRGGAKAILYSNKNWNLISSIRYSFGIVLAENKDGYYFT